MLTQHRLKEMVDYDPETGEFTWLKYGTNYSPGTVAGTTLDGNGYSVIHIDRGRYYGHRLAVLWMTGDMPKGPIRHLNRTRDDNRWDNLRNSTWGECSRSRTMSVNNTSGYAGVYRINESRWRVRIHLDGTYIELGLFDNYEDAVTARKAGEVKYGYDVPDTTVASVK